MTTNSIRSYRHFSKRRSICGVTDGGVATVTATWASSVFNGESDFIFTVVGDRVAEMRIPPH
jgi:hypothetical protein